MRAVVRVLQLVGLSLAVFDFALFVVFLYLSDDVTIVDNDDDGNETKDFLEVPT